MVFFVCVGPFLFSIQRKVLKMLPYWQSWQWPGLFLVLTLSYAVTSSVLPTSNTLYILDFLLPQILPTGHDTQMASFHEVSPDYFSRKWSLSLNSFLFYTRDRQNSSVKGQRVNILGLAGHMVSAATIELCLCSEKAIIDNIKGIGMSVFQWNSIYGH